MQARRSRPVELFWFLVFVFAVTQVTTLLAHDLTQTGSATRCWCWPSSGGRGRPVSLPHATWHSGCEWWARWRTPSWRAPANLRVPDTVERYLG